MDKELIEILAKSGHCVLGEALMADGRTKADIGGTVVDIEAIAALVAEECAKEADAERTEGRSEWACGEDSAAKTIAAAIRAKFPPVEKTVVFDNPSYPQWRRDNPQK